MNKPKTYKKATKTKSIKVCRLLLWDTASAKQTSNQTITLIKQMSETINRRWATSIWKVFSAILRVTFMRRVLFREKIKFNGKIVIWVCHHQVVICAQPRLSKKIKLPIIIVALAAAMKNLVVRFLNMQTSLCSLHAKLFFRKTSHTSLLRHRLNATAWSELMLLTPTRVWYVLTMKTVYQLSLTSWNQRTKNALSGHGVRSLAYLTAMAEVLVLIFCAIAYTILLSTSQAFPATPKKRFCLVLRRQRQNGQTNMRSKVMERLSKSWTAVVHVPSSPSLSMRCASLQTLETREQFFPASKVRGFFR